jgi:hypothetical protein
MDLNSELRTTAGARDWTDMAPTSSPPWSMAGSPTRIELPPAAAWMYPDTAPSSRSQTAWAMSQPRVSLLGQESHRLRQYGPTSTWRWLLDGVAEAVDRQQPSGGGTNERDSVDELGRRWGESNARRDRTIDSVEITQPSVKIWDISIVDWIDGEPPSDCFRPIHLYLDCDVQRSGTNIPGQREYRGWRNDISAFSFLLTWARPLY